MRILLGLLVVFGSVLGGFTAMGGHLTLLLKPFEVLIIVGGSIGAYIIAQPGVVLKQTPKDVMALLKGSKSGPDTYLELMGCLFNLMREANKAGNGLNSAAMASLSGHFDDPYNSKMFTDYPGVVNDAKAVTFICDFMRVIGTKEPPSHELEELLEEEIETRRHEVMRVPEGLQTMADGMPALGIVAAVMGVIKTMASIDKPPEVIGAMIGSALVGTFSGVLFSYGFFGPLAQAIKNMHAEKMKYYDAIKVAILAAYKGNPPEVSLEFARKILPGEIRPSADDVEKKVDQS